jgi:hypothetical protein
MTELNICPACQLVNEPDAKECLRCGRALSLNKAPKLITERVAKSDPAEAIDFIPTTDELKNLPTDSLALFIAGAEHPVILQDIAELILGRPMDDSRERVLDLTDYGAVNLGVSRRHALLSYDDGGYMLLDLGSTNGTRLNDKVVAPGRPYRLEPFDQITLGQLKMMVFFQAEKVATGQSILLKDTRSTSLMPLTPDYLATTVVPYLLALKEIEQVRQEGLGLPVTECHIHFLQASQKETPTRVRLIGVDEAIQLVRKWVSPWQKVNINTDTLEFEMPDKLRRLAERIGDEVFGDVLSEKETAVLQERLVTPLTLIATSGLELIWEPPPN